MSEVGLKYDTGKVRFGFLPGRALGWIARALEYGAAKYRKGNWVHLSTPADLERIKEALRRHINAALDPCEPEVFDAESGLPHLALGGANLVFLLYHLSVQGALGDPAVLTPEQVAIMQRLAVLSAIRDGVPLAATYQAPDGSSPARPWPDCGMHCGAVDLGPFGIARRTAPTAGELGDFLRAQVVSLTRAPVDGPRPRLAFTAADGKPLPAAVLSDLTALADLR